MKKVSITQEVKLFSDKEITGNQEFSIYPNDPDGPWVVVSHCGEEFLMKLENWDKLVELAEKAKKEAFK